MYGNLSQHEHLTDVELTSQDDRPRNPHDDDTYYFDCKGAGVGQTRAKHSIFEAEAGDNTALRDKESNTLYTKQKGQPSVDFKVSSDINKNLLKQATWKLKKETSKRPKTSVATAGVDLKGFIQIIDTFDRPANASVEGTYAGTGTYAEIKNEPGKRIPKAGAFAEAGVGRARAEFSVFEAEAKGPNVSASAEANVVGAGAMARAEIGSASASAGPVTVKVALGVDTGVSVGANGLEVKFLGTGFKIGAKTSISFLGSEVSCCII